MKKRDLLTIWAKRAFFALALAGTAGLMLPACDKKPEDPYSQPIDPVKVLPFGETMGLDSIQYENVMKYANDPRITTIIYFLDSTNNNNDCVSYSTSSISMLRGILSDRLNYTTKATGAGSFIFRSTALNRADSLWFVQNGWKIRLWQR